MANDNFFEKVYEVTRLIPYGRVTSYGAIARFLGAARSARMVGWALNNSHDKDVPAHRVVNRIGVLTGKHHFEGTNLMKDLLESEGVVVVDNQVKDFDVVFWDPKNHLLAPRKKRAKGIRSPTYATTIDFVFILTILSEFNGLFFRIENERVYLHFRMNLNIVRTL